MSKLFEIIAWLQIVASPLLIGLGIGAYLYYKNPTIGFLILAIALGLIGIIIGILWANKVWKTKGTLWFISRVNASPDLDNLKRDNDKVSEKL